MRDITVDECHKILIEISKEFHRICVKHNIPYYMLGGTMLGAIRHKGFIPWDDDMDFGIPRKYYNQFLLACESDLNLPYTLLTYKNSNYAILGFAKIMDRRTVVEEEFSPKTTEKLGVNIDIFPLDDANGEKGMLSFNGRIRTIFKFQKLLFFEPKNRSFFKKVLARCAQYIFHFPSEKLLLLMEKMIENNSQRNGLNMYANYFGAWGLKELVPITVFGNPRLYKFEDIELFGVQDYYNYLSSLYNDFMKIPKIEDRHMHQIKMSWLQD